MLILTILALSVSVVVALIGAFLIPGRRADLLMELSKGLIQLVLVSVLGAFIGLLFRRFDSEREQRRRLDDQRFADFQRLLATYQQIRSARRDMKAAGLHFCPPVPGSVDEENRPNHVAELYPDQVISLRAGMSAIISAHLALEQILREMKVMPLFDSSALINKKLKGIANHVVRSIREWQNYGDQFWPERHPKDIVQLKELRHFLADRETSFKSNISGPFNDVTEAIQKELFVRR